MHRYLTDFVHYQPALTPADCSAANRARRGLGSARLSLTLGATAGVVAAIVVSAAALVPAVATGSLPPLPSPATFATDRPVPDASVPPLFSSALLAPFASAAPTFAAPPPTAVSEVDLAIVSPPAPSQASSFLRAASFSHLRSSGKSFATVEGPPDE